MQNHNYPEGVSRRKFIGTITGAAALVLFKMDRRAIAEAAPLNGLVTDYVGRLCYNENPLGPSPLAITAMEVEIPMVHRYPDWYADSLVSKLADHFGVLSGQVVCGAGATEILRLSAMAFTEPGGNIVSPYPSYAQFPSDAQFFGSSVRYADLDDEYRVDLQAVYDLVDEDTTCVCITNANNPTGTLLDSTVLADFVNSLPPEVVTIVDEAYFELLYGIDQHSIFPTANGISAIELVKEGKNVVVIRTFSKAYGLAGARIGYAIGKTSAINSIKANGIYATVSRPSLEAAKAALDDRDHVKDTAILNREAKNYCWSEFIEMDLEYIPSVTNFFMVDVGDGDWVRSQLASQGIYVRSGWGMPAHIRVSTGTMQEMESFISALRQIILPGGNGKRSNRILPATTELFQAYPNPFNSSTSIKIFLPNSQRTSLEIFDIHGRLVKKIIDRVLGSGEYAFVWNGINASGKSVASGSYFYRLTSGDDVITRRMILIR